MDDLVDYDPRLARLGLAPKFTPKVRPTARPGALGAIGDPRADLGEEAYGMENMSEEAMQDLMGLGVLGDDMTENARQMALAEGIRNMAQPEGRQAGRAYVAASPLEHLATGLQKYQANKELKALKEARKEIGGKQTKGRSIYADILRGKKRKDIDIDALPIPQLGF